MKILRLWLLLLLAVLLPLRGAIAAAMPCVGEYQRAPATPLHVLSSDHHRMHGVDAAPGELPHVVAPEHAGPHHHDHAGVDKCNLGASCCSATPMPATFSLSLAPRDESSANFPVLNALAPSFLSEGQERPPRSI